ncbi:unnamed protein product [Blepharisma stoltei]|uniref:Flavin-containing monooxygenase n=1 Tax=Blepharisma stoltei TaxID=1481888 RepID=A0AAU9IZQ5_9CILI|nr:unnamed protein product [Blepharisma stoltei]
MSEEVCIIGGGVSGIVSSKIAKDHGLIPYILDKSESWGGIWKDSPNSIGVWRNLITNTSKYLCSFSDYPWPESTPTYPSNQEVRDYFASYINLRSLESYFHFNCKVIYVGKQESGYLVRWENLLTREISERHFPYVIVGTGLFAKEYLPFQVPENYPQGKIVHSGQYRDPSLYSGQRVIVIGGSMSACDIAEDLLPHAREVIQIVKNPYILFKRYYNNLPIDFFSMTKSVSSLTKNLSHQEKLQLMLGFYDKVTENSKACPNLHIDFSTIKSPYVGITNNYKDLVEQDRIQIIKTGVSSISSSGLALDNGEVIDADTIFLCTGFESDLSFLDAEIQQKISYSPHDKLIPVIGFMNTIHPELPGLAFLGMQRGSLIVKFEMQAEFAIRFFKNLVNLTEETINSGIRYEFGVRNANPRPQFPYPLLEYLDNIVNLMGFNNANQDEDLINFRENVIYIPQLFRLDRGEAQVSLARQVIAEIKEKFHIENSLYENLK